MQYRVYLLRKKAKLKMTENDNNKILYRQKYEQKEKWKLLTTTIIQDK